MSELGPGPDYKMTLRNADRIIVDALLMGRMYVRKNPYSYGLSYDEMATFMRRNKHMLGKGRKHFLEGA